MAFFTYPAHIDKDTPAVASEVQTNFDALLAWIMDNVVQKDGTVAMDGPLVTPPGPPSSPEHAADKAYVDGMVPVGTIFEYAGTQLPANWLWCDGQTYTVTSQQKLFNSIQYKFNVTPGLPGTSFQVPDRRKKVGVGADLTEAKFFLGQSGGQRDSELFSHVHMVPEHGHGASGSSDERLEIHEHGFSARTTQDGQHGHNLGHGAMIAYHEPGGWATVQGGNGTGMGLGQWLHDGAHQHTVSGATDGRNLRHAHHIAVSVSPQPAFGTNPAGNGTALTDRNLQPFLAVNYIIYAGTP